MPALWIPGFLWLDIAMSFTGRFHFARAILSPPPHMLATPLPALAVQALVPRSPRWRIGRGAATIVLVALAAAMRSALDDTISHHWIARLRVPEMRERGDATVAIGRGPASSTAGSTVATSAC